MAIVETYNIVAIKKPEVSQSLGHRRSRLQAPEKEAGLFINVKAMEARFDGRVILSEEPVNLPANTPVRVLVTEIDDSADITREFSKLSKPWFSHVWDNEDDAAYV